MSARLSSDLAAAVVARHYKPAGGVVLSAKVVDAAIWSIIGVVRTRTAAGERAFWRYVGVFEPVAVKPRRRWVVRYLTAPPWFWQGFVQFPGYSRLRFRRSAYMDALR